MKRALLIAGGTVGGLGAVLAITPPQLNSTEIALSPGNPLGGAAGASTTSTSSSSTTSSAAQSSQSSATQSSPVAKAAATKQTATKSVAAAKSSQSQTSTSSATSSGTSSTSSNSTSSTSGSSASTTSPSPAAPSKSTANGEFTGTPINVGYGIVQVKITVQNGKITDAVAVQAPSGRNDRYTNYAIPVLTKQTLAAQSDAISGASGASYTSYGWYKSLQSALTKAGML